jgi:hypothetical protein
MKRTLKVNIMSRQMACVLFRLYIFDISNTNLSRSAPMLGREPGSPPLPQPQTQGTTTRWLACNLLHGFTFFNLFSHKLQQRHSTNIYGHPGRAVRPHTSPNNAKCCMSASSSHVLETYSHAKVKLECSTLDRQ